MSRRPKIFSNKPDVQETKDTDQAEVLFNSIGDGAIAADEYGRITRINPTALKILGFREAEILGGWYPNKIVALNESGKPISIIDRPITKAFLTGKPVSEKVYYLKKNGQMVPVSSTLSPIIHNNRPVGAIDVFRDITLEYEIDRMKSEFISLASHQLRTPLSTVKTYSHLLSDGYMGELNDKQRKALNTIISASNRMNELISTLLNITRIESGSIAIHVRLLKLNSLLKDVISELEVQAIDKGITIDYSVPDKPIRVRADRLIVKEIISNLLANALKYSPPDSKVSVGIQPRRGSVVVYVKDTGVGIPKFSQDQVFTKFFRAPNVIKSETNGTGLGLYLVKGLTERLGGKIWFESEENKGSTFFLSLPITSRAKPKSKPS